MGFGKMVLAAFCGELAIEFVRYGLRGWLKYEEMKSRELKERDENKNDCEIRYSFYGNGPKSDIPNARKVGFGENG